MEVAARPPAAAGRGFLLPHQIYHETTRPRIRIAPHEFYDGSMPRRSVMDMEHDHDDGDDAAAAPGAWLMSGVAAAATAVASLPETTAAAGEDSCAVCLEGYVAGDALRTMPCAHAFHGTCIVDWLSVSSSCPLCRFRLPTQAEEDDAAQHQQESRRG